MSVAKRLEQLSLIELGARYSLHDLDIRRKGTNENGHKNQDKKKEKEAKGLSENQPLITVATQGVMASTSVDSQEQTKNKHTPLFHRAVESTSL